jgi:hypothetical protein
MAPEAAGRLSLGDPVHFGRQLLPAARPLRRQHRRRRRPRRRQRAAIRAQSGDRAAGRCLVSIFPSTDIRYNFIRDEFFLPLNLEVGKSWGPVVASLEGGVGIIHGDHPPYDWKLEARLGFRF